MESYSTLDESYSTQDWSNTMPELLPEDVETFLGKIKVTSSISRHSSTFSEVFKQFRRIYLRVLKIMASLAHNTFKQEMSVCSSINVI